MNRLFPPCFLLSLLLLQACAAAIAPATELPPFATGAPLSTPSLKTSAAITAALKNMTLSQKIGQMLIISFRGNEFNDADCQLMQALTPGGIFYQPENVVSPAQLRQFSANIQKCAETNRQIPLFITIDHEGEINNSFTEGATTFPTALAQGSTGDPAVAYQVARRAGQELAYSGVNMVFGPVADVLTNYDNRIISQRTYGGSTEMVAQFVSQAVIGYRQAGVIPVLKHFPGHGGIEGDSHNRLHTDMVSLQALENDYLPPFHSGIHAGATAVMINHIAFPTITGEEQLPASQSAQLINLLRQKMEFQGITISDAMNMKGIAETEAELPDASVQAIQAGLDILLLPANTPMQAIHQRLVEAVQDGVISNERIDEAVQRILVVKTAAGLDAFPLPETIEPDWQANQEVATQAGRQAVALLKNEEGLVPLPKSVKKILVIGPDLEWDLYSLLDKALKRSHASAEVIKYSVPHKNNREERLRLEAAPSQSAAYDLVIFLTWQSHISSLSNNKWQVSLVNRLMELRRPLIVIALKTPTDILDFPTIPTYITTSGTTSGQAQALVDILTGKIEAQGKNPLPYLLDQTAQ